MNPTRKLIWVYFGDHVRHPFIELVSRDLVSMGHQLLVVDDACELTRDEGYTHISWNCSPTRAWVERLPRALTRVLRHVWFVAWAVWQVRRHRPHIVICTMPTALLAGAVTRRIDAHRLVYYPFELFGEQVGDPTGGLKWLERRLLHTEIDALITQNQQRAQVYEGERGSRVTPAVVRNFKPAVTAPPARGALRAALDLPVDVRIVLYEGGLVPRRWLDRLLPASLLLPSSTVLVFLGHPTVWWEETYAEFKSRHPQAPLRYLQGVPYSEVSAYVMDADVGVIIYDDTVRNHLFCEPGKLCDYVSMSVPVVAPDFPTIRQLIEPHRIGALFADTSPEGIASTITSVLDTSKEY